MDTVFSHIIQKRFSQVTEDVATDALAFIVHTSEHARAGFMKLLRRIEPGLPDLMWRTQQSDDGIRPDMWGFADSTPRVYVENKFWAGLTSNQPVAYLHSLAQGNSTTILLVIAPAAREQMMWRELLARMNESAIGFTEREGSGGAFRACDTSLGPILAMTSWTSLLASLEQDARDDPRAMSDLQQLRALCIAADSEAFIPISRKETSDQRIPAFIMQLYAISQESVGEGLIEGFLNVDGLSSSASSTGIGRYFRFSDRTSFYLWIGIRFDLWRRLGNSPLWLLMGSNRSGHVEHLRAIVEPWAARRNAPSCLENSQFCIGLSPEAGVEKAAVVRGIVDELRDLSRLFPVETDEPEAERPLDG